MSGDRHLSPIILQSLGVLLLVASFVFWIFADRESALLVSAALTLVGAGGLQGIRLRARDDARDELDPAARERGNEP